MSNSALDRWGIIGAILTAAGGAISVFVASKKGDNNSNSDKK